MKSTIETHIDMLLDERARLEESANHLRVRHFELEQKITAKLHQRDCPPGKILKAVGAFYRKKDQLKTDIRDIEKRLDELDKSIRQLEKEKEISSPSYIDHSQALKLFQMAKEVDLQSLCSPEGICQNRRQNAGISKDGYRDHSKVVTALRKD